MEKYDHQKLEQKWRKAWEESNIYKTPTDATKENKMNILPQLPYPSGAGLHAGHSEVYTACDIYARFERMQGKKVLQVIGWDAFGLPAENYAIKTNIHPRINTDKAIETFTEQIKSLGISLDWDRSVGSHNPDYYKWTQWFFLLMYERGLAYRAEQQVNWCPSCKTVLANEQVVNGHCERCDSEVEQKMMEQWYLKITEYADRLYEDLDKVDWPSETVKRQRDWIGRKRGININYEIDGTDHTITCFTSRPETGFGATFIVVAPEGEFVQQHLNEFPNKEEVNQYVDLTAQKTELERLQEGRKKTGVFTGWHAVNPLNGKKLPIYTSDYVLGNFGTGAVMGVPGHDIRDFEFAEAMGIEVIRVVSGKDGDTSPITRREQVNEDEGMMINSEILDGMEIHTAIEKAMDYIEEKGWGKRITTFKLHDWSVSRQRFWGAPIPMVYDAEGNIHPVKKEDLPVILPDDVDFLPTGRSPLNYSPSFQEGVEEKYGKGWRREVDTLDTFMCSSWYFFRYIDPHNNEAFASPEALRTWMPVDFYLGGPEHVNGHLLYSRFFTKVLFDAGYIDFDEPFLVHRHQGTIFGTDGRRMSKRWGNIINPTDVVAEYGADTVRTYLMFMGPLEQDKSWNIQAVQGVRRFMQRVSNFSSRFVNDTEGKDLSTHIHKLTKFASEMIPQMKFNVVIAKFMETMNEFEANPDAVSRSDWEQFIKMLAPFAPFLTEEIWHGLGYEESVHNQEWPTFDTAKTIDDFIQVAIQINGKLRDTISIANNASEQEVISAALLSNKVRGQIEGKEIKRNVYIPGKILNIVI